MTHYYLKKKISFFGSSVHKGAAKGNVEGDDPKKYLIYVEY